MRRSLLIVILCALTACAAAVPAGTRRVPLDTEVTLAPGETAIAGDGFAVQFVSVLEDSRCPHDVTCVWAGQVRVQLALKAGSQPVARHEVVEHGNVVVAGYRVTIVRVQPRPLSTGRIQPGEYRVTLIVSKT